MYEVTAVPPLLAGAVNATVAVVDPVAVAVPIVGASGTAYVVIDALADEEVPLPAALVANTVNVYAVLLLNPETVMFPEPACETVPVIPPGEDTAV